jgi:hypothetical protein
MPLQPTDVDHKCESGSSIIHMLDEQRSETRIHTDATINLGSLPATIGAKFDYKHASTDSATSFMIQYWIDGQYAFDQVARRDLKFTPEAKEYARAYPREFRKRYGDYFIIGYQRRYSFRAIVNYK